MINPKCDNAVARLKASSNLKNKCTKSFGLGEKEKKRQNSKKAKKSEEEKKMTGPKVEARGSAAVHSVVKAAVRFSSSESHYFLFPRAKIYSLVISFFIPFSERHGVPHVRIFGRRAERRRHSDLLLFPVAYSTPRAHTTAARDCGDVLKCSHAIYTLLFCVSVHRRRLRRKNILTDGSVLYDIFKSRGSSAS
jgi:hypothetical protein